ncbi:uncharacterized protein LOC108741287 isoform X2 [Agrilus planipennis]|uniref:Uncharacterized protein LOC108741287 isoform X2 n=1 Tax=Agrilus planipennis TaxID=224129 RepID=A0A1W4X611_AGRPL|nr:uncharacterized protein LOC108741287 isoform X2 [Agrilus planipennis]
MSATLQQNDPESLTALILELNGQVASLRDLLIHIGQDRDCSELREKIRRLRRNCVEGCKFIAQLILPQLRSAVAEGIPVYNSHHVLLFFMSQLLLRELTKCHRLVQVVPMDMSGYYENRAGPSNLGNVISQILLCKQITPDFNQEELCSIAKDSEEIVQLLTEMQEFLPKQETNLEHQMALTEDLNKWTKKSRGSSLCKNMRFLCCIRRTNYL